MSVSFVSLRNTRVHLQNNTFILRKVVENHCDMACYKYCKIVASKEVCLHCVTVPLQSESRPNASNSSVSMRSQLYISGLCVLAALLNNKYTKLLPDDSKGAFAFGRLWIKTLADIQN